MTRLGNDDGLASLYFPPLFLEVDSDDNLLPSFSTIWFWTVTEYSTGISSMSDTMEERWWRQRQRKGAATQEISMAIKAQRFLKKVGLGKEDYFFWKHVGKGLLCTYALFGAAWLWNETSPLGWWTLKPRPKEEKEMAHLYERRKFPYPGDKEAVDEFLASGGALGTTIGPKGIIETGKDSDNFQKKLQSKKFEQESLKMWIRMRNEVISDLQEKGYDIE